MHPVVSNTFKKIVIRSRGMQDKLPSKETLSNSIADVSNTDLQPSATPSETTPVEKEASNTALESLTGLKNEDIIAGLSQQSQSQPSSATTPEVMSEVSFFIFLSTVY